MTEENREISRICRVPCLTAGRSLLFFGLGRDDVYCFMKVVLQRVTRARVEVGNQTVGQIADGLLVLLGITHADTEKDADTLIEKIIRLRIFEDDEHKMNKSILDIAGGLLIVSQFTLYADVWNGNRPSFTKASRPEHAEPLYNYFLEKCIDTGLHVESGEFGAHMQIDLINDGPVTLVMDSE